MKLTLTFILLPFFLAAQVNIRGIIEFNGEGIPGATVQIVSMNEKVGTITDAGGKFMLGPVPKGKQTLEVRSVGFKVLKKDILVSGQPIALVLEESTLDMDEVVITGTMNPTFVSQSPVKIDIITSDYLTTYTPSAATSVMEGISLVNGVQEVVACGVCFTNSISINGLPGPYTAILMDGAPIYGNLASVYGLNGIPAMMIDRFEVIRGPSSTLYGSEAVAGVINIITKDPKTQPPVSVDLMGTSQSESYGTLSFAPRIGKSNGFAGINYAYIHDFLDKNNDGFGDKINLDRISFFTKWEVHRASGKKLTISGKYYYEDRRNGVEQFLNGKAYRSLRGNDEIYGESIYTNRMELFGTYELPLLTNVRLDYSLSNHEQSSYYGADHYKASQNILFTNFIWNNSLNAHDVTIGLTSRYQAYDDNTFATEAINGNQPDNQYIPGVFAQTEWKINSRFTTLAGLRLDHYEDHGLIWSPRLSHKYKLNEWTSLRSNFGTGFRIVNLFTEDHAFVTGQREVIIEEALKPEESYNFSLNFNHLYTLGTSQGMIDIDAYYTYFTNKITPDYEQENQIVYANVDGFAISQGIGINLQHEFHFPLSFNLGYNLQDVTETELEETREIEFAPQWTGVITSNYQLKKLKTTIGYSANFTGPMALPEVFDLDENGHPLPNARPTRSASFAIHNVQVSKNIKNGLYAYFGVRNLLNYQQPWSPIIGLDDPGSNPGFSDQFDTVYAYSPINGRQFFLGVNWSLAKK